MTQQQDVLHFLKAFIRNPAGIGAIVPSAPELARAMMDGIELGPGETVLELGPGTGAFTTHIREIIPCADDYLGIELETRFVELLELRFPDLQFIGASAAEATSIHQESGLGPVKVIISSLPFASLMGSVRDAIIDNLEQLMNPGCLFRTFQYVHSYPMPSAIRFRRRMEARFGDCHRSRAVLPNLPPAYVLTWQR
jgi:phospholipid N-methyltransferase